MDARVLNFLISLLFIFFNFLYTEYGDVRLVGGTNHCNGVLELLHHGEWRPGHVYSWSVSAWNLSASALVCKQLDCGSAVYTEHVATGYDVREWRITSSCDGSESSLKECATAGYPEALIEGPRLKVICSGNNDTN